MQAVCQQIAGVCMCMCLRMCAYCRSTCVICAKSLFASPRGAREIREECSSFVNSVYVCRVLGSLMLLIPTKKT